MTDKIWRLRRGKGGLFFNVYRCSRLVSSPLFIFSSLLFTSPQGCYHQQRKLPHTPFNRHTHTHPLAPRSDPAIAGNQSQLRFPRTPTLWLTKNAPFSCTTHSIRLAQQTLNLLLTPCPVHREQENKISAQPPPSFSRRVPKIS